MHVVADAANVEGVNRAQRVAMTAALAVVLVVVGWTVVPFSAGGAHCGSAVRAVALSDPPRPDPRVNAAAFTRRTLRDRECRKTAEDRLIGGGILLGLAAVFAGGSYRLLADSRSRS